ncbi:hypothetical protein GCM10007937_38620 [Mesorhizobium albiziae]|nr:hypothetical protein GCM10007937_38620 [Mesorhizobium albiziae]
MSERKLNGRLAGWFRPYAGNLWQIGVRADLLRIWREPTCCMISRPEEIHRAKIMRQAVLPLLSFARLSGYRVAATHG